MTAEDRTGRPAVPPPPRRVVAAALALSAGLAVGATTIATAGWPGSPTGITVAAAEPGEPGTVTFRVVPVPTTAAPTPQPPTPRPAPSDHLPVTGGGNPTPGWLPALGAMLVLTGAVTVVVARRSRRPGGAGPTG
ncbi:hypothetical protein V1634_10105 [Plantactinospora veratri]|uniref:Gram-positive cocci surface proteins LPxTG domain-containing protein n=1 Tax=Plantactinospora veratri TaxID=1436122 RepID=A0ABU7SB63_9ACTN